MTIIVKSRIEKGSIRIPKKVGLPDGTKVIVSIEPILGAKERKKNLSKLFGAWSNDPTLITIFKEIEKERHSYFGREVDLE